MGPLSSRGEGGGWWQTGCTADGQLWLKAAGTLTEHVGTGALEAVLCILPPGHTSVTLARKNQPKANMNLNTESTVMSLCKLHLVC